ncbi:Homeobox protein knotted-1-like [Musa troglodytarum]|uniref:Homeobox protein knotted-1-like n=1 Tax=Musa troglodytarum TaxID=320322 RepID=A0A9E7HDM2_9LILI|nr:Homeobox protein knotted-1-like [Musa troglodytarum]URE28134.1 Homeobox protein knotted-1-like [Musa troglodytarum]URE28136.1 Homeobox protein knotted-1-like [Musa troglodytarum]
MRPAKPAASAAGEESGKPLPPTSPPGCSPSSQSYQLLWTSTKVHILTILNNPRSESRRCWTRSVRLGERDDEGKGKMMAAFQGFQQFHPCFRRPARSQDARAVKGTGAPISSPPPVVCFEALPRLELRKYCCGNKRTLLPGELVVIISPRRNCSSKGSVVMAVEGRGGGKKRAGRSRREQQQKVGNSGQLRMWADAVPHESHPGRPIRPTPSHGPTRG